jgi:hypothetical protein
MIKVFRSSSEQKLEKILGWIQDNLLNKKQKELFSE